MKRIYTEHLESCKSCHHLGVSPIEGSNRFYEHYRYHCLVLDIYSSVVDDDEPYDVNESLPDSEIKTWFEELCPLPGFYGVDFCEKE